MFKTTNLKFIKQGKYEQQRVELYIDDGKFVFNERIN